MNKGTVHKRADRIQERLTNYACALDYDGLPPEAIHAAKVRVIDTLGSLIGGFYGEPCRIARNFAAQIPDASGATVIGTRMKTTAGMAAFVNGTTARYLDLTDFYHWPGSYDGHPSDVVMPVLAAAECAQVSGRELITGVVLAYEIFCRMCDVFHHADFDNTNFCCLASATAAGKLLGLSPDQLSHCISMAIVPNVVLRQVRLNHISMWKVLAAGHAGRAGVFAAELARAGMQGPHLPFEGKAGWCDHVARERFSLDTLGGNGTPFKILDTRLKNRPCSSPTIAAALAVEKIAPFRNIQQVTKITVEVYRQAREFAATGAHHWNPETRDAADHSIPYVVAAALIDGTITPRSFNDAHLRNPQLRALMQKVEVVENEEFTRAYERLPQRHRTRVAVATRSGERLVVEAGGDKDELSEPLSDKQAVEKFRGLTEDRLGSRRVNAVVDCLWHLDRLANVAELPGAVIFD